MNEQANTQLVQAAYGSVQNGDPKSLLNLLSDDVLWVVPDMENVPFAGTRKGREAVAHFFQQMAEAQDIVDFKAEDFIAQGDKVVVLGHFTMHVKATGKTAHSPWAHLWIFEGGKVREVREYVDSLAVNKAHTASNAGRQASSATVSKSNR